VKDLIREGKVKHFGLATLVSDELRRREDRLLARGTSWRTSATPIARLRISISTSTRK
jgi:hypothetical protein